MTVSDQITRTAEEIRQILDDFGPERWVEALESGQYTHMQSQLGRHMPGMPVEACCIGVLAHAAGVAQRSYSTLVVPFVTGDGADEECDMTLAPDVAPHWLIATATNDDNQYQDELVDINDNHATRDYARQIDYIKEHIIPAWRAGRQTTGQGV